MKTFSEIRLDRTETVAESLDESKMSELQDYIDQGKSAEWIAKKIGFPVKDVKDFLKNYKKESVDEGVDKSSPVYKEYLSLKKMSIKDLRRMVDQQHRGPVDLSQYDKQGAISDLLRNKFGNKAVATAMGLDESVELDEAKRGGDTKTFKTLEDWLMAVLSIKGVSVSKFGNNLTADGLDRTQSATFDLKKGRGSLRESLKESVDEVKKVDFALKSA